MQCPLHKAGILCVLVQTGHNHQTPYAAVCYALWRPQGGSQVSPSAAAANTMLTALFALLNRLYHQQSHYIESRAVVDSMQSDPYKADLYKQITEATEAITGPIEHLPDRRDLPIMERCLAKIWVPLGT